MTLTRKSIALSLFLALANGALAQAQEPAGAPDSGLQRDYQIEVRGYLPPESTHQARPVYHDALRRSRVEGTVTLEGRIDREGRVRDLRVEDGHRVLARSARQAVLQWRYRAAQRNGVAIDSHLRVLVHFRLAPGSDAGRSAIALAVETHPLESRGEERPSESV